MKRYEDYCSTQGPPYSPPHFCSPDSQPYGSHVVFVLFRFPVHVLSPSPISLGPHLTGYVTPLSRCSLASLFEDVFVSAVKSMKARVGGAVVGVIGWSSVPAGLDVSR
ncbi:hypothetical protein QE152_g29979 [Popillia japonica]|uniref:Uncharacterized protein n=1 Tax=Popillia japonica TaxID=7064 RepID=A0AAW1JFA3_POPJA